MSKQAHAEKQVIIDEIKGKLDKAKSAVVIDYIGITVEEANGMRKKLREADVDYTIYKNTMVKRALEGTGYEELGQVLTGPSAFAFGYDDATAPARVLNQVIKELKKMEFKAGIIDGTFFDAERIKKIAGIPSKDVLIAKFMGSIQSPISKAVRTFAAIAEAKGEGAPAEAKAEPEAKADAAPAEEAPTETKAEPEAKADVAPAEEAPTETKAEPEAKADAAPAEEAPTEAKTEPEAKTDAAPAEEAPTEAKTEPEAKADAAPVEEAPTETKTEAEPEAPAKE